jgi:preprotein translocase subunit SecG
MTFWTNVLVVLHVVIALAIIGLVLLQHGKGADMGSGFGGGASGSLFGATGSANFLSRTTAVLAALFFILSLALAYVATRRPAEEGGGVIDAIRKQQTEKPAAEERKAEPQKPAAEGEKSPAQDVPKPPPEGANKQVPQ